MIDGKGHCFAKVITLTGMQWYLAYPLSDRDGEAMMEKRSVPVNEAVAVDTLKNLFVILFALFFFTACENQTQQAEKPIEEVVNEGLDFAVAQYKGMLKAIPEATQNPRTVMNDTIKTIKTSDWTGGFFPGSLWFLYEYTGDEALKKAAIARTAPLEAEKTNTRTHDLGFMLYNSFGNAYRLTEEEKYMEILLKGANSLATRFHPNVGCIRSWDHGDWQFPVIIDNMMNLEFLFWATDASGNQRYVDIALSHADTTLIHHYRDDYSTWHVVDYDTTTGEPIAKMTHQGAADESAWARGQAWGFYGYTMMYRETKDEKYLTHAKKVADFLLTHPNLPDDFVPYWDFNAPNIPNEERDASAGAIMASALLELSQYTSGEDSSQYVNAAEKIIRSLSSEDYRAALGENNNFILMHSVGSKPHGSEIDVPLNYADYYYIESLLRMKDLLDDGQIARIKPSNELLNQHFARPCKILNNLS
jgi:rhamnogalacturonyl hydrolase YesR